MGNYHNTANYHSRCTCPETCTKKRKEKNDSTKRSKSILQWYKVKRNYRKKDEWQFAHTYFLGKKERKKINSKIKSNDKVGTPQPMERKF